jgi:YggT family protein
VPVLTIVSLIVDTIASVLGGVLLLRFWMQAIRVRPPAPVAQFTFQLSDWLVRPLRRLVPGVRGYDWASLIGAYLVVLIASALVVTASFYLQGSSLPVEQIWTTVLAMSVYRLLIWITYGFIALLIVEAVFSWVNPHAPLAPFIHALNDPLLRPLRRVVPLVGGLDLSLLVALILLQIIQVVLNMLFKF